MPAAREFHHAFGSSDLPEFRGRQAVFNGLSHRGGDDHDFVYRDTPGITGADAFLAAATSVENRVSGRTGLFAESLEKLLVRFQLLPCIRCRSAAANAGLWTPGARRRF